MTIVELGEMICSVLAIGMAIYALLEVGTYLEEIEDFARRFRLYETSVNAQLENLRKRIETALKARE